MSRHRHRALTTLLLLVAATGCARTSSTATDTPAASAPTARAGTAVAVALHDLDQPLTWDGTGTASAPLPALQHRPVATPPTATVPGPVVPPLPLPGGAPGRETQPHLPTLTVPTGIVQLQEDLPSRLAGRAHWTGASQDQREDGHTSSGQHLRRAADGTTFLQQPDGAWIAYRPTHVLAPYLLDPTAARALLRTTTSTGALAESVTVDVDPHVLPANGQLSGPTTAKMTLQYTSGRLTRLTLISRGTRADGNPTDWTADAQLTVRIIGRRSAITARFDPLTTDPNISAATVLAPLTCR